MSSPATIESIGEWNGQEQDAVDLWNAHIAPVISALIESQHIENGDMALVTMRPGLAAWADDWAWAEFCGRLGMVKDITTDFAEALVIALADELRERGQ